MTLKDTELTPRKHSIKELIYGSASKSVCLDGWLVGCLAKRSNRSDRHHHHNHNQQIIMYLNHFFFVCEASLLLLEILDGLLKVYSRFRLSSLLLAGWLNRWLLLLNDDCII